MIEILYSTKFKKELKKQKNRGKDMKKFINIAERLAFEKPIDPKHRNHKLIGNFNGRWECHIEPDWLLIYVKTEDTIIFERTGTHSDLFK